ncbi:MAG: RecX family transcriptional regulator [Patescibacteria group bacterium]
MPEVTAITPQKKPGRLNIFIDGRFAFGLNEEDLYKSGLKTGQVITEDDISRLKKVNDEGKVLENVLHFLEFRPRSEREIRTHIKNYYFRKKKSESEEEVGLIIENILVRLSRLRLLDDRSFAVWWLEQRQNSGRPQGKWRIKLELTQKGISREIIDEVLASSGANEFDLALKAVRRKLPAYTKLPVREGKFKITRYLLGHGFSAVIAREVIKQVFADLQSPSDLG